MNASLKNIVGELKVRMGELGIVEGPEIAALSKLEKLLAARADYDVAEERVSTRERRLDKDAIKNIVQMRNMGVSSAKIGEKHNLSGMMVLNICAGRVYKDVLEELAKEGIKITR